jgi:Copper type II ascorbate-dependent monooxygenase, C-terminal domain
MTSLQNHWAILGAASAVFVLAGCSGGDGGSSSASNAGPTYVRDIQPLVEAKCSGCHSEGGIAPFVLETYEQVSAMKDAVAAAVTARTMPPWLAAEGCTDYRGDRSLTDEQIDIINEWAKAGAPQGNAGDTPVTVEDERLSLSRIDYELALPEAYTPQVSPDDYRCFFVDWPAAENTFVTGFGVTPDNDAIVHHTIAFLARPDKIAAFQALDDAEAGPGWTCYGGPGGDKGSGIQAAWIGAWAPGGVGADFPAGTGIEVPAGSKLVIQMHYNTLATAPSPDRTKILVRTDASVEKKALVVPFANPNWVKSQTMTIPAHTSDVSHSFTYDPTVFIGNTGGGVIPSGVPLKVHSASLHMHTLGERAITRIDRASGDNECMLDIPRWNFHWQGNYGFSSPKQINPGDKLYLECQWDNPGSADVNWGEGTSDEMCLGTYYITE